MKQILKRAICALLILLYFYSGYTTINTIVKENEVDTYECLVIDKLTGTEHHKYSASNRFILVLKTTNHVFDIEVSPSTFSQAKINDVISFDIKKHFVFPQEISFLTVIMFVYFGVISSVLFVGVFILAPIY